MLDEKQLNTVNKLIRKRDQIKHVLRGLDSPYVATTVGLINTYSNHVSSDVKLNDEAKWFHNEMQDAEEILKEKLRGLLKEKEGKLISDLAEFIKP